LKEKGVYSWDSLDQIVKKWHDLSVGLMGVLVWNNELYEPGGEPRAILTEAGRQGFANYAAAAAERYANYSIMWELW